MKKTIAVDLDGTLVEANTFTLFCKYILKKRRFALPILFLILLRKMRFVSHARVKQMILKVCHGKLSEQEIDNFASGVIENHLNLDLSEYLAKRQEQGYCLLLATAAPALYARKIAALCRFDACLATEIGEPENASRTKAKNVEIWLKSNNAELEEVFTDHHDDLPLVELAFAREGKIILVNPSEESRKRIIAYGPIVMEASSQPVSNIQSKKML